MCLAASPRSWIPADLFFIRAIPHHCLLLLGPGFINLIVLLFRFLGFFYRHPSLRSTRPSFLVLIPITSSCSIRSQPLIPFGVLQHYTNLPSHPCVDTTSSLDTSIDIYNTPGNLAITSQFRLPQPYLGLVHAIHSSTSVINAPTDEIETLTETSTSSTN